MNPLPSFRSYQELALQCLFTLGGMKVFVTLFKNMLKLCLKSEEKIYFLTAKEQFNKGLWNMSVCVFVCLFVSTFEIHLLRVHQANQRKFCD